MRLANTLRACPRPLHTWFHPGTVDGTAHSPDGRLVLTWSERKLHGWDTVSGQAVFEPVAHEQPIVSAFFSKNGSRIVSFCHPEVKDVVGYMRVLDSKTGKALSPPLRTTVASSDSKESVSAEADFVAVGRDQRSVQIWDVNAGKFVGEPSLLPNQELVLKRLLMRPDGKQVAALAVKPPANKSDGPTEISLWNVGQAKPVGTRKQNDNLSVDVDWRPTSDRLFIQHSDTLEARDPAFRAVWSREVSHHWLVPDGRIFCIDSGLTDALPILDGGTGAVLSGKTSPTDPNGTPVFRLDGRLALIWGNDGKTHVHDIGTFLEIGAPIPVELDQGGVVGPWDLSADGKRIVLWDGANAVRIWDVSSGKMLTPQLRHLERIAGATFTPDGSCLLTWSGNTVSLWPVEPAQLGDPVNFESTLARIGALSPDGNKLVLGTENNGRIDRLELYSRGSAHSISLPLPEPFDPRGTRGAFNADGTRVVIVGNGKRVFLWDSTTGKLLADIRDEARIRARFAAQGDRLLLTRSFLEFRLVDGRSGAVGPWHKLPSLGDIKNTDAIGERGVALLSPDGVHLVHWPTRKIVDVKSGEVVCAWGIDTTRADVHFLDFSPNGRRILDEDSTNTLCQWDMDTGKRTGALIRQGSWNDAVYSPDGARIAASSVDSRIWDAESGLPVAPVMRHALGIRSLQFSPDGRLLLTTEDLGTNKGGIIRVWNTTTGKLAAPAIHCPDSISHIRFNDDGRLIVAFCFKVYGVPERNETWVWETATGQLMAPPMSTFDYLLESDDGSEDRIRFFSQGRDPDPFHRARLTTLRSRLDGLLEWVDLSAASPFPNEERTLAELLSGRHIDGTSGPVPLESDEVRERWERYKDRLWSAEARRQWEPRQWHRREAAAAAMELAVSANRLESAEWREQTMNREMWHLDRLLVLEPGDAAARQRRASLRLETRHWPGVVEDHTVAIAAGEARHYERGNAYASLGRWAEAEADFTQAATSSAPADVARRLNALQALALVRLQRGNEKGWRDACAQMRAEPTCAASLRDGKFIKAFTAGPDAVKDWSFLGAKPPSSYGTLVYRIGGQDQRVLELLPAYDDEGHRDDSRNLAAMQFFRAMARHRLQELESAAAALKNGRDMLKADWLTKSESRLGLAPAELWQERVYAELLEREAAKKIKGD
jgi:WD40 repeat protein